MGKRMIGLGCGLGPGRQEGKFILSFDYDLILSLASGDYDGILLEM